MSNNRFTTVETTVDGIALLIEVSTVGTEEVSRLDRARGNVSEAFDRAQESIAAIASATVATIHRLRHRAAQPDEMQVKFGLKFAASGGVIVAGVSSEATLEVVLTYKSDRSQRPNSDSDT